MRIIQISEALAIGDAVANDVVAIDKWLKSKGIPCGIYVTNKNNIASKYLHTIAETIDCLPNLQEDDLLLFHHAISQMSNLYNTSSFVKKVLFDKMVFQNFQHLNVLFLY